MNLDKLRKICEKANDHNLAKYSFSRTFTPKRVGLMLDVIEAAIDLKNNSARAPIHAWEPFDAALTKLGEIGAIL